MPKPKKRYEAKNNLFDIDVIEVSVVGSPAVPKATFAITKRAKDNDNDEPIIMTIVFKAVDVKKQRAYGYALVPDEPDSYGDVITAAEVEKACHSFMKNLAHGTAIGNGGGKDHAVFGGVGYPIESVMDPDGSIAKAHGAKEGIAGGWWLGFQITDAEVWKSIEEGESTGFSIGGVGKRSPIAAPQAMDKAKQVVKDLFNSIRKEDDPDTFLEAYQERKIREDIWKIFSALEESILSVLEADDIENKAEAITNNIEQFKGVMLGFVAIAMSANKTMLQIMEKIKGNQISEGEESMAMDPELKTALEAMQKATTDAIAKVANDVEELKKKIPTEAPPEKKVEKAEETNPVLEELKKITERMDKIEKKPNSRNGEDADESDEEEEEITKSDDDKTDKRDGLGTGIAKSIVNTPFSFRQATPIKKKKVS